MTHRVPLRYRGEIVAHAIIDDEDAERVLARTWRPGADKSRYAVTKFNGKNELLHRFILGLTPGDGKIVDHINQVRLDCRRCNMRIGDKSLNAQNRNRPPGNGSQFRGVSKTKAGRYVAVATIRQKQIYLGTYVDELEAALIASSFRADHMPFSQDALEAAA